MTQRSMLEAGLTDLQDMLNSIGEQVERAISAAVDSLKNSDIAQAEAVIKSDEEINQLEDQVMELGAQIIATQQPVAKDMRKILTAFRNANDLERMADLAVDIAKVTLRIGDEPLIKPLVDIPRLADIALEMLKESMECYVTEDIDLAYKMAKTDDEADHLYSQILRELFVFMIENPNTVNQAMLLCFVGRYLERIADYATNIGENVVYLVNGKRVDLN